MYSQSIEAHIRSYNKKEDDDKPKKSDLQKKIYQQQVCNYFKEKQVYKAAFIRIYSIFRYQFISALYVVLTVPLGLKSHFNFYGLNPLSLTKKQAEKHPTLLIHGRCHNQGVWIYLAKVLQNSDVGPLFTINISSNLSAHAMEQSFQIIYQKIADIQQLYQPWTTTPIKVNIVGYSMGAIFAYFVNLDEKCWKIEPTSWFPERREPLTISQNVNKLIVIGSDIQPVMPNAYDIVGEEDILVPPSFNEDLRREGRQILIPAGHLNIVQSSIFFRRMENILSENEEKISNTFLVEPHTLKAAKPVKENKGCFHRLFKGKIVRLKLPEAVTNIQSCTIL